jgi:leucyl aminopeptidase
MTDASKLLLSPSASRGAVGVHAVSKAELHDLLKSLSAAQKSWVSQNGFEAAPGTHLAVPDASGKLALVLYGKPDANADPFEPASLCRKLPAGKYALAGGFDQPDLVALGWVLEAIASAAISDPAASRKPRTIAPAWSALKVPPGRPS